MALGAEETDMRIAVAGATGRVGRHVVEVLEESGHEVVPIARSRGVDIVTGKGLRDALAGVESVVDAASAPSPEQAAATEFFTAASRSLQAEGARAGVRRMVVVSIIGIDRFTGGYMAAKLAHERAMLSGPVPAVIVRAAQFHEFVGTLVDWGRQGPVSRLTPMRTQLVAARTVASVLADLATRPTSSLPGAPFLEIAGPRPEELVEAARRLVARLGDPVRIEGATNAADPSAELYEAGALLPGPGAILAGPTFQEWLDAELPVRGEARATASPGA